MGKKISLSTSKWSMDTAYLFMKDERPARYLIIAAHGCQAEGKPSFHPQGRVFAFYGPNGKVITCPPVKEVIERTALPFETYERRMVEDYWISKYAGSQNKLGADYTSFDLDLSFDDKNGEYHIFSVRRRLKGIFGKGIVLLSEAVALAETWNKLQYEEVFCMFCRGVPGQPTKGSEWEHTYLDNKRTWVK